MERLTERVGENGRTVIYVGENKQYEGGDIPCEISDAAKREVLKRLAAYEDAEEQGRLLVLPCKVGDPVYYLTGDPIFPRGYHFSRVESTKCVGFYFDEKGLQIALYMPHGNHGTYGYFGETIFRTLEEAKAKWKEM